VRIEAIDGMIRSLQLHALSAVVSVISGPHALEAATSLSGRLRCDLHNNREMRCHVVFWAGGSRSAHPLPSMTAMYVIVDRGSLHGAGSMSVTGSDPAHGTQ